MMRYSLFFLKPVFMKSKVRFEHAFINVFQRKISQINSAHGSTLTCRIQPPGWLLGLVLDFPPLAFITALGFLFFPPLAIIQPLVFSSSHPWLLFSRWFWFLPTLGYYSALGFIFFPPLATIQPWVFYFFSTLVYYPALGSFSAVPVSSSSVTYW